MMLTQNQGTTFLCLVLFYSSMQMVGAMPLKAMRSTQHTQNNTIELLNEMNTHTHTQNTRVTRRQLLLKHSTRRRLGGLNMDYFTKINDAGDDAELKTMMDNTENGYILIQNTKVGSTGYGRYYYYEQRDRESGEVVDLIDAPHSGDDDHIAVNSSNGGNIFCGGVTLVGCIVFFVGLGVKSKPCAYVGIAIFCVGLLFFGCKLCFD